MALNTLQPILQLREEYVKYIIIALCVLAAAMSAYAQSVGDDASSNENYLGDSSANPQSRDLNTNAEGAISSGGSMAMEVPIKRGGKPYLTAKDKIPAVTHVPITSASASSAAASNVPAASPVNFAGNYNLTLSDRVSKDLNLTLIQQGDIIIGRGDLAVGGSTTGITASGVVRGDTLALDIVSPADLTLYKAYMRTTSVMVTGTYKLYSTQASPIDGSLGGSFS